VADLDFQAETIKIERQWNAHTRSITPPKHESRRTIAMTEPVRARLLDLPRESEWVLQLGHQDGGRLVRALYGHPDAALARERTRRAFRSIAPVEPLPVAPAA
jgi:hypothetical protein